MPDNLIQPLAPKPQISDHEPVKLIGSGSYGDVWLCRSVIGTCRGVKVVYRSRFKDERPFTREFRGIQSFEPVSRGHPGLVAILQVGMNTEQGYFYYVMEAADDILRGQEYNPDAYIPRTLENELDRRQRLPLDETVGIGRQLLEALGYLHEHELVHRDVKPSNIIFVGGKPKLADIGLVTPMKEMGTIVGTLDYMPQPPQKNASDDLYSLGKVLYVMSTGNQPREFPTMSGHLLEQPDADRLLKLNRLINKTCALSPAIRYQTAAEMRADLRALSGEEANSEMSAQTIVSAPEVTSEIEPAGGAVPLDSYYYVERPVDRDFIRAIERRDSIVLVKGARQMGKTSLLARGLFRARQSGARVVLSDFQKLDADHLSSADALFRKLADFLADQLELEVLPEDAWDSRRSPNTNFERYLRRQVLTKLPGHFVWGMDEVDRLFSCSFASEVFGLLRSWHNERALDPSGPWSRLTLAIAYATEAYLFITDVNQSPFNVGTRLSLDDFTPEQVADLNKRYGSPLTEPGDTEMFNRLLSGQPYLVRHALNELASGKISVRDFADRADREEGPFGDHLRRILVLLTKEMDLCDLVRSVLQEQPCRDTGRFYRLRSAGVLKGDSPDQAQPRCQIYANYLRRNLF